MYFYYIRCNVQFFIKICLLAGDDTSSVGTTATEPFAKSSDIRHSLRSSKYVMATSSTDSSGDSRHHRDRERIVYRQSDVPYNPGRPEIDDGINSGLFRLSLQGYNSYMERYVYFTLSGPVYCGCKGWQRLCYLTLLVTLVRALLQVTICTTSSLDLCLLVRNSNKFE